MWWGLDFIAYVICDNICMEFISQDKITPLAVLLLDFNVAKL
jgi:hypothetical protein